MRPAGHVQGLMNVLFLITDSPYRTQRVVETLEAALVAAVFDQQVSVLLKGDAVWSALPDQDVSELDRRSVLKILTALPEYDVEHLYVCAESLAERGLEADTLGTPVETLTASEQRALLDRSERVIS